MYRIEVFGRDGTPLAELHNLNGARWSYALNKAGSAVFDIAIEHIKATNEILAPGNVVIIHHDSLEKWGGYIVPRQWPSSGDLITIGCASTIQRLSLRVTDVITFEHKQAAEVFAALITQANKEEHTGIYVGDTTAGTTIVDFALKREHVYDRLQELLDQSKLEWSLTYVDPQTWLANLSTKLGRDLTGTIFIQGGFDTVGLPDYSEDPSTYANKIIGVGKLPDGTTVPDGTDEYTLRPTYEYRDPASITLFGLAEDCVEFDTTDAAELTRLTIEEVTKRAYPKVTLSVQIANRRELWGTFTEGDIIAIQLPKYGFTGVTVPVRVLGREIDDGAGTMTVACEIVTGSHTATLDMFKHISYGTQREAPGVPTEYPEG